MTVFLQEAREELIVLDESEIVIKRDMVTMLLICKRSTLAKLRGMSYFLKHSKS